MTTTALPCPGCGYDLRACPSAICPECGLNVESDELKRSAIPWVYRGKIGWVRAYLRTVWQFTFNSKALKFEASKPQSLADAIVFRRVHACLLALVLISIYSTALWVVGGLEKLAIRPLFYGYGTRPLERWKYDLAVPWSAAATRVAVLPICLTLLSFWITGVQRAIFRQVDRQSEDQHRAYALAFYSASPLIFLAAVALIYVVTSYFSRQLVEPLVTLPKLIILGICVYLLLALCTLLATFARIVQWRIRTRHCSLTAAFFGLAEVLALWIIGIVVCLGVLPWCFGLIWVMLDSLF